MTGRGKESDVVTLAEIERLEFRANDALRRGRVTGADRAALVHGLAELRLAKSALLRGRPDVLRKAGSAAAAVDALSRPSNLVDQAEARKTLIEAVDRRRHEERRPPGRPHDFSQPADQAYAMAQIKAALARPLAAPWDAR